MQRTSLGRSRAWASLTGQSSAEFLDALEDSLRANTDVPRTESEQQWGLCRRRSPKNRALKLNQAEGRCEACEVNLWDYFGIRGDRGLEVHHLNPLSETAGETVETALADLAVLRTTCHRLIAPARHLRQRGVYSVAIAARVQSATDR